MIGVLTSDHKRLVVREFFELFKTPWEPYQEDGQYEVLICCDGISPVTSAKLVIIYGEGQELFDKSNGLRSSPHDTRRILSFGTRQIPIYCKSRTFQAGVANGSLFDVETRQPALVRISSSGQCHTRVGFDLFDEVRHLLSRGQPSAQAGIPTLELHIALLRDLILSHGVDVIEIPPVPAGSSFIACLTHDVDHPGIRNHRCDHTMFGFLSRALFGSLFGFFQGKRSIRQVFANWIAALKLPFVYFGWATDFWKQFDRYTEVEKGIKSTFFVIPRKGDPGQRRDGPSPARRAAGYDISEVSEQIGRLLGADCEIGVHGIDAWRDVEKGEAELNEFRQVTGLSNPGIRMHWLFFDEQAPALLEKAGFSYDSTFGFAEAIGYRAGTTQVFKPLGVERMLELPLHIMDTALFYPAYLNVSQSEAEVIMAPLVENAVCFGGVLVVNWHDRSIAPERLWNEPYLKLIGELKKRDVWFATGHQAVSWFQKRREATIEQTIVEGDSTRVTISMNQNDNLPGLRLRLYKGEPKGSSSLSGTGWESRTFVDVTCDASGEFQVAL